MVETGYEEPNEGEVLLAGQQQLLAASKLKDLKVKTIYFSPFIGLSWKQCFRRRHPRKFGIL